MSTVEQDLRDFEMANDKGERAYASINAVAVRMALAHKERGSALADELGDSLNSRACERIFDALKDGDDAAIGRVIRELVGVWQREWTAKMADRLYDRASEVDAIGDN